MCLRLPYSNPMDAPWIPYGYPMDALWESSVVFNPNLETKQRKMAKFIRFFHVFTSIFLMDTCSSQIIIPLSD